MRHPNQDSQQDRKRPRSESPAPVTAPKKKGWYHAPLVSTTPLSRYKPCFFGAKQQFCLDELTRFTGKSPSKPQDLTTTPEGGHLKPDENGVCGYTSNGEALIYSATKVVKMIETSPNGKNTEKMTLYLLTRESEYVPKKPTPPLSALCANPAVEQPKITIKATPETRKSQLPRSALKSQNAVLGESAQKNAINYFAEQVEGDISKSEIENQIWNWCHQVSCAIAQNAKAADGTPYNPQVPENLFAGTRVLNENMMRIENPVLQLLNKSKVKEIEYTAFHWIFTNSHMLADVRLEANILMHDHRSIKFSYAFSVDENRKFSPEFTTALYAALSALAHTDAPKSIADDCVKQLSF